MTAYAAIQNPTDWNLKKKLHVHFKHCKEFGVNVFNICYATAINFTCVISIKSRCLCILYYMLANTYALERSTLYKYVISPVLIA